MLTGVMQSAEKYSLVIIYTIREVAMALGTQITLNKISYRTLFDSLPGALLIVGFHRDQLGGPTECRILDVNSEFEAFCGLGRDELLGKKPADLFPRFEEDWGGSNAVKKLLGRVIR